MKIPAGRGNANSKTFQCGRAHIQWQRLCQNDKFGNLDVITGLKRSRMLRSFWGKSGWKDW